MFFVKEQRGDFVKKSFCKEESLLKRIFAKKFVVKGLFTKNVIW